MKKLLIASLIFLSGCSTLDTTVTSINNYSTNFILKNYETDKRIPSFRPGYIFFGQYNPEVSETFYSELSLFARNFKKYSSPKNKILITGYIDIDEKNREFNTLGKKRAEEVKAILIRMGISTEYILINDMGGKKYFNSNKTIIDKAKNRCITIEVFKEKNTNKK